MKNQPYIQSMLPVLPLKKCRQISSQLDAEAVHLKAEEFIKGIDLTKPQDIRPELGTAVEAMLKDEIPPFDVTRFITTVADLALENAVENALEKCGPAPAGWMYMLMGSEGRTEQTLRTDQDSAIVYEEGDHQEYFIELGSFVSRRLNDLGFLFCKGNVMASNPKWVMKAADWEKAFTRWVDEPEPLAVMQSCIFFDLRCGLGEKEFESGLRDHISKLLGSQSGLFFYHMAQNALKHSVPLGWFGGLSQSSKTQLDIKKAMLPIVDHARIYVLKNGIEKTNTRERIIALMEQKSYKGSDAEDALAALEFFNGLRLRHQVEQLKNGADPDNEINPSILDKQSRDDLIFCLKLSKNLQQNIGLNFRAGY